MVPRKMVPGKLAPGKMVLGKFVPGKLVPGKLRNEKSWGGRRASWCVWNVGIWSIYENPKLDNKPKTRKQTQNMETKKSWGERRASWCVCGMFGCDQSMKTDNSTTNTKLGNKPKTRKQKIVGWASSIVVCAWNVRMWSIYENPKLDNKSPWTPLVFYSLVHM